MLQLATLQRHALLCALMVSGMALLLAHGSELAGLNPCPLCLTQRQAHWTVIALAGLGLVLARTRLSGAGLSCGFGIGLSLTYLVGSAIAFYHAGVEWSWFPAPKSCSGGGMASISDLADAISQPMRIVSCAEAPFRFLGLSMAGWNGLLCLGMAGFSLRAAIAPRQTP